MIEFRMMQPKAPISLTFGLSGMLLLLAGCSTYCGIGVHCSVPDGWPLTDTFSVTSITNQMCIGGSRGTSCYNKGVYPSGAQVVDFYGVDDDDELRERITSLTVNGNPGDEFRASCFEYNGTTRFGFTEVLIGIEIRNTAGLVVATHPTSPVTRRDTIVPTC